MAKTNRQGRYIGGIWYPSNPSSQLKKINPKGYNKHKKNPCPSQTKETIMEEFAKKTPLQQKEEIAKLGNQLYILKKDIRPLQWKFTQIKDYYDMKHFGWKWGQKNER